MSLTASCPQLLILIWLQSFNSPVEVAVTKTLINEPTFERIGSSASQSFIFPLSGGSAHLCWILYLGSSLQSDCLTFAVQPGHLTESRINAVTFDSVCYLDLDKIPIAWTSSFTTK